MIDDFFAENREENSETDTKWRDIETSEDTFDTELAYGRVKAKNGVTAYYITRGIQFRIIAYHKHYNREVGDAYGDHFCLSIVGECNPSELLDVYDDLFEFSHFGDNILRIIRAGVIKFVKKRVEWTKNGIEKHLGNTVDFLSMSVPLPNTDLYVNPLTCLQMEAELDNRTDIYFGTPIDMECKGGRELRVSYSLDVYKGDLRLAIDVRANGAVVAMFRNLFPFGKDIEIFQKGLKVYLNHMN